jgi:hypothetical protein
LDNTCNIYNNNTSYTETAATSTVWWTRLYQNITSNWLCPASNPWIPSCTSWNWMYYGSSIYPSTSANNTYNSYNGSSCSSWCWSPAPWIWIQKTACFRKF